MSYKQESVEPVQIQDSTKFAISQISVLVPTNHLKNLRSLGSNLNKHWNILFLSHTKPVKYGRVFKSHINLTINRTL